jgi:tetratricopeptide (TPR) repeat protein
MQQENHSTRKAFRTSLIGPALFALALLSYSLTLAPGFYPGIWAGNVALHSGIGAFPSLQHPLWSALISLLARVPVGSLAFRLNIVSALLASASVWMLYSVTVKLPVYPTDGPVRGVDPSMPARRFAGIVAALTLAFCMPFWLVATRAHPAALDLALFLAVALFLIRLRSNPRGSGMLCLFALVYGLAVTEYPAFIAVGPVYGLLLLYILWQNGALRVGTILLAVLCFLAGTFPYYLQAWFYSGSPVAQWRGLDSYFAVLWQVWRGQYIFIAHSVPRVGWLLLFFTALLPWVATVANALVNPGNHRPKIGTHILHGALSVLAVALLFNVRLSPWTLFHTQPLLVMPYLVIASWTGYLAGYWFHTWSITPRRERSMNSTMSGMARWVGVPVIVATVLAAGALNARAANGRVGLPLLDFTRHVLDSMEGRTWLISSGVLDDALALEAWDRGQSLKLINASSGQNAAYLEYVASQFESQRLKALAKLGLGPLVRTWLSETPGVDRDVAILDEPDLWLAAGYNVVPNQTLYFGTKDQPAVINDQLLAVHRQFWRVFIPSLRKAGALPQEVSAWREWLGRVVSRVANNLGVAFQDVGQPEEAAEAYDAALELDEGNLSALLNKLTAARRAESTEAGGLEQRIRDLTESRDQEVNLWALARQYGYVANPSEHASHGWAWAITGRPPQMAAKTGAGMTPGSAALATGPDAAWREAEARHLAALDQDPGNMEALQGMVRIGVMRGAFAEAKEYLGRMEALGADEVTLNLERAAIAAQENDVQAAKALLLSVVKKDASQARAWGALARIADAEGDAMLLGRCVQALGSPDVQMPPAVRLALADILLKQGETKEARELVLLVLKGAPGNIEALEALVRIDVREARRDLAEEHLSVLLNLDADNALGNHVLGSLYLARQDYQLAEAAFRVSVASQPTPAALNDLAWVLTELGRYDEAVAFAENAVALQPSAGILDTLGVAQLKAGQVDKAEQTMLRALQLAPDLPAVRLHLAEVYEAKKMNAEALQIAESLLDRAAEMSPDMFNAAREMVNRMRPGAP